MLRRGGLLVVLTTSLLASGCSIDRVEWETSGFPVEDVRRVLEEEHGAESPDVECIQREVQGADYECRGYAEGGAEYHCHVKANTPRKRIHELECEAEHEEGRTPAGSEPDE